MEKIFKKHVLSKYMLRLSDTSQASPQTSIPDILLHPMAQLFCICIVA